jgi:hypothetical protein
MTVDMISGARDTEDILAVDKKVDMGPVHMLEDDRLMLTRLLSKLGKREVTNTAFKWMTDEIRPKFDQLAEALDNSETAVDVDNGAYFNANDLVKVVETGEIMRVASIATNTLTVVRGVGSTAATAAADNGQLLIIGNQYAQGATLEAALTTKEVEKTAYTQIMRDAYHLTGTEQAMGKAGGLYSGEEVNKQRGKKLLEHERNKNLTAYWGESAYDTSTRRGLAGGVNAYIPAANRDGVATLTESEWNDGLKNAFRYGSGKKVVLCSRSVAGIINEYMANVQRVAPGDSKFGVKMVDYISPHGEVSIVTDHALEGTEYDKYAFVLDIADCKYVAFKGRDTQLLLDRQATDEDGIKEEYLTEFGFEWGHPSRHYVFTSVTG